ncbi:unnamed protein product [Rangifer tarandus platyrhynchus]|uniref:Uncharacterized protein n=1 Tax=Rangifer tarandus platyrhynchus TaxID=3082113 RepID=A0ABN8ZYF7_RANTA|nr:unnamed protein product [Rangifer tarandus platyrhynchus]
MSGKDGKESACNAGDPASIPGLGRSPVEGNDYPFQYSCLENPMNRGAWRATVHRVAELDTTEWFSTHVVTQSCLTLCHPIDFSPPGSSVQRIYQAKRLE